MSNVPDNTKMKALGNLHINNQPYAFFEEHKRFTLKSPQEMKHDSCMTSIYAALLTVHIPQAWLYVLSSNND